MNAYIDRVLQRLAGLIQENRYEEQETERLEIKPVPAEGGKWKEFYKSVDAFLNTRGGIIILGIKEEGQGEARRYVFTGYRDEVEAKLKELPSLFTDRRGVGQDLQEAFPPMQIREFLGGRVALVFVDELPSDRKYVFYRGEASRRLLTGDHRITEGEIERQEEYKEEVVYAREIQAWPEVSLDELDIDVLNDYIQRLNHRFGKRLETIKADIHAALAFLQKKSFVKDGRVTLLGMLVCGKDVGDYLGFRCHVHGHVDIPYKIAQDKQDFMGNVLYLMDASFAYILRNIQVGISVERGGSSVPQYPEEVLRETVNNALAHRDYSVNKHVSISIHPGRHIAIKNPGCFRRHSLIELTNHEIPLRRIIPEEKARNPKLAGILRVYDKWEGEGKGMATLVNLCLENRIDIPVYRLYSEEVCLFLRTGQLLDERMEAHFKAFDGYIEGKTNGIPLSTEEKLVLSYLIKSEWENESLYYTVLLTQSNNHFDVLRGLKRSGLIDEHPFSNATYPVYIADRALLRSDYRKELSEMFGESFPKWDAIARDVLNIMYRHGRFSKVREVTAKIAANALWFEQNPGVQDIRQFDAFYRKIRRVFNKLEESRCIVKIGAKVGYVLNEDYRNHHLL